MGEGGPELSPLLMAPAPKASRYNERFFVLQAPLALPVYALLLLLLLLLLLRGLEGGGVREGLDPEAIKAESSIIRP